MGDTTDNKFGVFRPGVWLLTEFPGKGRRIYLPMVVLLTTIASPIAAFFARTSGIPTWVVGVLIGIAALSAGTQWYMRESESRLKDDEKRRADQSVRDASDATTVQRELLWALFQQSHEDAMGNVAVLIRLVQSRDDRSVSPTEFDTRLRQLQTDLLRHIVQTVSHRTSIESRLLGANWVMKADDKEFEVIAFDRNQASRQAGRRHDIAPGLPGASQAFLSGDICLVPDTQAPDVKAYFSEPRPYRTILSIPVRVGNERIIGVVNVDCASEKTLRLEHAYLVGDGAYLIGLCQVLREKTP